MCDDEKIYALSDDDNVVCIAELHGDDASERHANGILMVYAPMMREALKAMRKEFYAHADLGFDGLSNAVFRAGMLLSQLDVEANAETEDTEA